LPLRLLLPTMIRQIWEQVVCQIEIWLDYYLFS